MVTYEQGVCFGNGHDAHDGGDATPKGNQPIYGVACNVCEGPGRAPMHLGWGLPCEGGQVQLVQIVQEVALQKLQQAMDRTCLTC